MITVERYVMTATRVTLELRVTGVDAEDLAGVGGQVRPASGGDLLVAWDWSRGMAPTHADEVCTRHVTDLLTSRALEWLGGGATIDLGGGQDG